MERKPYERRFAAMEQEASSWIPSWKSLSKFICPTRGFFDDTPNSGREIDHKTRIDGSPGRYLGILAAGMTSGLTSAARPWFKLGFSDKGLMKYERAKLWLEDVQDLMLAVFAKSNIYGVLYSIYEELGGFGTAASMILPDFQNVIYARSFTIGEYYLATGAKGQVNTFGRKYWMTTSQLVEEYGIDNVSYDVRRSIERNEMDRWVAVRNLIVPNPGREPGKIDSRNMRFKSISWEAASPTDSYLRIKGFEEFPVLAPRWKTTTTADAYGKGPSWDCAGDTRMLQKMQRDKLVALDKLVDPPVQIDASIPGEANTLPGGVTRSNSQNPNAGIRAAYQIDPHLQALDASIQATKGDVRSTFYADLFLAIIQGETGTMTAREVVERHEEKLQVLGPVLDRLKAELLDPLIERTFAIMERSGMLPPPPPELGGMDLKVEYISMLAQAQKMVGTTAIEQFVGFVGKVGATYPRAFKALDPIEAINEYGEALGVSPRIINTDDEIADMEAKEQKAAAQAQGMQNAMAMVQGAKVMADTKMGQNSALDAALGGMTGNATGAGIPQ